jgi:hypothetical protein
MPIRHSETSVSGSGRREAEVNHLSVSNGEKILHLNAQYQYQFLACGIGFSDGKSLEIGVVVKMLYVKVA